MAHFRFKLVEVDSLQVEPLARELIDMPEMAPYRAHAEALVLGQDPGPALAAIRALPLEQRYLWRVMAGLGQALADFDSANVHADRTTLEREELLEIGEQLRLRPVQFCLLLRWLIGPERMENVMREAIELARQDA